MKIVIDAFGGDNAPDAIIDGTILALKKFKDVEIKPGYLLVINTPWHTGTGLVIESKTEDGNYPMLLNDGTFCDLGELIEEWSSCIVEVRDVMIYGFADPFDKNGRNRLV